MKAFKLFWKIFALFSSIFVLGFFSYNIWDDYVRAGFEENDGYEWIANKMPEYEEKDLVQSDVVSSKDISDIEAEIEAEMEQKAKDSIETERDETNTIDPESVSDQLDEPLNDSKNNTNTKLDAETIENEEPIEGTQEVQDDETVEEEEEVISTTAKTENRTTNCFDIVDGGMTCPKHEEIIYIEAEGGKAKVFLKEGKKYFIAHSVASVYNQLGEQRSFYKTKKYLINLNHLIGFIPQGTPNSTSRKIDLELIESKDISIPYAHLKPLREQYIKTRGLND